MEASKIVLQKCDHNKLKPKILFVTIGCRLGLIDFTVIPGETNVFLNISASFTCSKISCGNFENKEEKCIEDQSKGSQVAYNL